MTHIRYINVSLSKSQIQTKLKKENLQCYPLSNTVMYVPTKDRQASLRKIYAMFVGDGAKAVKKSKYSAVGAVELGQYTIVVTRMMFHPSKQSPTGNNKGVKNRLAFGAMIQDVIANTLKPLTIVFSAGKKVKLTNITGTKFEGKGVADFVLLQGTKKIPMSVRTTDGSYRHKIDGARYTNFAQAALEQVVESGDIDAEFEGDEMVINTPIVFEADQRSIRELMFNDINNGLGVVGNFKPEDYKYDGKTNTLTIKCSRVYESPTDLKSTDKPYFVVLNSTGVSINDLDGIGMDLVPKRALPKRITLSTI